MIPYDHWVLDDFFPVDVARRLENEFPDYNEPNWHWYNNPLENNKEDEKVEEKEDNEVY